MFRRTRAVLSDIVEIIRLLRVLLESLVFGFTVRPTGFGKRTQLREEFGAMAKVFTYVQGLVPAPEGVANQRLTVEVDGVKQEPPIVVGRDSEAVEFKAGPEGATVVLTLDYLDEAGNDSGDISTSFVVADEIAPEAPVGFGTLTQIAEESV